MKRGDRIFVRFHVGWFGVLVLSGIAARADAQERAKFNTARIEEITGGKGTLLGDESVFKLTFPRTDVPIKVDGRTMEPFLGFMSWAAFKPGAAAECMVMGDLVLFEDEVSGAMDACLESGVAVTALHNHFFFDEPKVYFMHIGGEGSLDQLAGGVKKALDEVKSLRCKTPQPAKSFGLASVRTHGVSESDVVFNVGFKWAIHENVSLMAAMGRSLRSSGRDHSEFLGLWGLQFTF